MPPRKYHNPPKVNAEGRYDCRLGCGKSYPREWECCRHEERMCELNADKEERPRLRCQYNCGRSYVRRKDVKSHERTSCELNPESVRSRSKSGLPIAIQEKKERHSWYAKVGELKPNEYGIFLCRWCGKDFGASKATCREHEQYRCEVNEAAILHKRNLCCRYNCGLVDGFFNSSARDDHERQSCWKHLTLESSSFTRDNADIVRSALQQLDQLEALDNGHLDWNIGSVENPLESGLSYPQWLAVFILQEAPEALMEVATPLRSQDKNEQWVYPQYLGTILFNQTPDASIAPKEYLEEFVDDTLVDAPQEAVLDEKDLLDFHEGVLEDENDEDFEMDDDDEDMKDQTDDSVTAHRSTLRQNCETMDRLRSWNCPWDTQERYCEGSRFLHGFVDCPGKVILQLANCATPYKSNGNRIEWKPQCYSCYYTGKRIGMWMVKGRVDKKGRRVCDAARACKMPVLEPYHQCEKHFEAIRASLRTQRLKVELQRIENPLRQSYGKEGYKISTAAQLAQFLTGRTIRPSSEWVNVKQALLEERGAYNERLFFVDTEFCNSKTADGPPILLEVALVNGRGEVVLETVINHQTTIGELTKRAKAASPLLGPSCVAKVYGKVSEAMTPGLTLSKLADVLEELDVAGAVMADWSTGTADFYVLYKALSAIGREGILPPKGSWLCPLREWRRIVPGLSSWGLEWAFDLMFPESDLKSHHRARVDALKLYHMSRKITELMS